MNIFRAFFLLSLCAALAAAMRVHAEERPLAPPRGHAHNDYEHARPLLDALDHGFTSVEADIHLVGGQLLVAHDLAAAKPDRTLESLYLAPLAEWAKRADGKDCSAAPLMILLVDIKGDAVATWKVLCPLLEKYRGMMSECVDGAVRERQVKVILSGNRPVPELAAEPRRLAFIDGRPDDLERNPPASLVPLVSAAWPSLFTWRGEGDFPADQRKKLEALTALARAQGRHVRFWGTPENEKFWNVLLAARVDLFNADDLPKLQNFLAGAGTTGAALMAYVGTYSSPLKNVRPTQVDLPPGNGRGIHLFRVDRTTGAMTPAGVHEMDTSPSCLAVNAAGTRLYSANETERTGAEEAGSVSAFSIDRASGQLALLNTVSSGGKGPAHLSIHPSGKFVLVANYFGGSVAVLPVQPDGSLADASDIKKDAGTVGPTKATNAPPGSFAISGHDQPHAHMIEADPSGRRVLHVDPGLDQIYVWKFDDQNGLLTPNDPHSVALPPGDGPRHFAFHPNHKWLYSIQEEASTVVLFDYDTGKGSLTARQTVSSLPPGFAGSNFCSEIMVSPDGRFVYAGNRLHDSIGIFAIGENGTLKFSGEEWTRGNYPRSFNFDPSGAFLYCCNQRGDNIASFRVDKGSGALAFTGHYTPVGNPSIVVFVDLKKAE